MNSGPGITPDTVPNGKPESSQVTDVDLARGSFHFSLRGMFRATLVAGTFMFTAKGCSDQVEDGKAVDAIQRRIDAVKWSRNAFLRKLYSEESIGMGPDVIKDLNQYTLSTISDYAKDSKGKLALEFLSDIDAFKMATYPPDIFLKYTRTDKFINSNEIIRTWQEPISPEEMKSLYQAYTDYILNQRNPDLLNANPSDEELLSLELEKTFHRHKADNPNLIEKRSIFNTLSKHETDPPVTFEEFAYLVDDHRFFHKIFDEKETLLKLFWTRNPTAEEAKPFADITRSYLVEVMAKHSHLLPAKGATLPSLVQAVDEGIVDASKEWAKFLHYLESTAYVGASMFAAVWLLRSMRSGVETDVCKIESESDESEDLSRSSFPIT